MLGKLMKYEFKACGRTFIPLYCAILLMSIIVGFSMNMEIFNIMGMATLVLVGLFVALGVLTIMITIQRFRKNLLEDEGYLMFTLPVTSKALIFSKYSITLIYTILSGIVSVLSFTIVLMLTSIDGVSLYDIWHEVSLLMSEFLASGSMFAYMMILLFISYSIFILTLYLSVSMGQLPVFNKHRNIAAFVSFFVINIVISKTSELLSTLFDVSLGNNMINISVNNVSEVSGALTSVSNMVTPIFISGIVIYSIFAILLFFGITYILDKKLNLE
ncbi:ABC transporter permease [Romboutsia weinsteinii]|uniref:ABC transporter permease n=1 Tax=Romboutsia weinsteinii TaxID=2020949 RepID=A0A371J597_9FIRM|nr:hypothetical protein [Romboutsia weinsteinii]RDY27857.1 ABC transporter permease [Romboutsia weinsteinii]